MSEEITASVSFDVPTMLVGLHWHNRLNQYRRLVRIAVIIVAVSALSTTWLYPTVSPTLSSAVILSCGAGGSFLGLLFEKRRFVSSLKTSPLLGEKLIFVADEEWLHVTSPHSRGYLAWTLFHRTVATPDGALLYHQKIIFNWLPKTAFASEADYSRFLDLLAAKTKHSELS